MIYSTVVKGRLRPVFISRLAESIAQNKVTGNYDIGPVLKSVVDVCRRTIGLLDWYSDDADACFCNRKELDLVREVQKTEAIDKLFKETFDAELFKPRKERRKKNKGKPQEQKRR